MPESGDYVLLNLTKVLTGWGKEKMQLGDAYRVKKSEDHFSIEWVPYTEKILKAKGVTIAEVLEWSKADGQVAMWRDYLITPPKPAKKTKASPQKKRKTPAAAKATASSSSSSSSSSTSNRSGKTGRSK